MLLDALLSRKSFRKVTLKGKAMLLTSFVNLIPGLAMEWEKSTERRAFSSAQYLKEVKIRMPLKLF